MRTQKLLLVLLISLPLFFGHGWLNFPVPRAYQGRNEGSASQTSPCGNTGAWGPVTIIKAGSVLGVDWTRSNGHEGDGPDAVRFAIATDFDNATLFDEAIIRDNIDQKDAAGTRTDYTQNLRINFQHPTDPNLKIFDAYIQYKWIAGDNSNWWGCGAVQIVQDDVNVYNLTSNSEISGNVKSGSTDYYRVVDWKQGEFLTLTTTDLLPGTVIKSRNERLPGDLPTERDYSVTVASAGASVSLCTTTTVGDTFLSLTHPSDSSTQYTINTLAYDATLTVAPDGTSKVIEDIPNGGKFYYTTDSSSRSRPLRAVVVNKGSPKSSYSLTLAKDCALTDSAETDSGRKKGHACVDLYVATGRKYLFVDQTLDESDTEPLYSVLVERGDCETFSASGRVSALFVLVAAMLALLVF